MKAALVVAVALVAAASASGAGTATRVVERTLLCTVPEQDTFPDPTPQLFAKGNISSGQLVVAKPGGKRLAYGSAAGGTGEVKLFAAKFPTCS